ncbi:MAG: ChrR family anti-sigma-E factor [Pseudomonadales bacterium]|nr:ChrR family anti-sigma-E factor [Pseudomonadales bacterium]
MLNYHPDSRFLTDYAAGNLPTSQAVCVATHLEFCAKCRAHVQQLTHIGCSLFEQLQPEPAPQEDVFARLMQRIDQMPAPDTASATGSEQTNSAAMTLPRIIYKLANGSLSRLSWVQLGQALRVAPVCVSGDQRETAIYDIKAGGRMPEHEHRGEEITVLLKGSFSDADGTYRKGDFIVRNCGETHQPMATQDADCICLVCLEKPIKPKSWWYRLLEPYVQYRLSRLAGQNLSPGS